MTYDIRNHIGKFVAADKKSTVRETKSMTPEEIKEYKRLSEERKGRISQNAERAMGLASALGKDDRIFYLKQAIDTGNVNTLEQAVEKAGVGPQTVKKYIKEMGYRLDGNIIVVLTPEE